ncbi:MAG: 1,4-dihydroxy-6-naphthoate synthase [Caldimicrobium thiodismutans]|uniref:1,4-dihydroxy-6-naphtoate synthase n=1 Tax=Caldimicrobium thiodismutans TaxID=1653476 RepID=A0A2N7PKW3_9BACT|nr:MAG: 1,4-dihydroxy-6-naphthoate synthase [Caldimicrobium thiodismutans]
MSFERLEIAASPCPNDVFILSGLIEKKVKLPFEITFKLTDIETLNTLALKREYPIIKASFAIYPLICEDYEILSCGSALGFGVGPILISREDFNLKEDEDFTGKRVALPGKYTTANFLYDLFFNGKGEKVFLFYHQIIPALLEKRVDLGVLIHEGRFVYKKYGFKLISDLGELWEKKTGAPLPLGGFFIKRELPKEIKKEVLQALRKSLEYAWKHKEEIYPLLKKYSQELDREVIFRHIETYVNKFTFRLEDEALSSLQIFMHLLGLKEDIQKYLWDI